LTISKLPRGKPKRHYSKQIFNYEASLGVLNPLVVPIKKTTMKRIKHIVFFSCFIFCVFTHAQEETIIENLSSFTKLKCFDGISVKLIKSDLNKAEIYGENKRKVAIVNNDGVLKIRMKVGKLFSGFKTFINLYYTEELVILDVNEDALINSDDVLVQEVLELKAQEGGEINLNCQTEQLLIKAVTGGDIITEGFSENQDIKINTGGTYNGKALKTKFTTISVSAGGSSEIYATNYVKAIVKAGGNIKVYGNPKKIDEKKLFGGVIERIE